LAETKSDSLIQPIDPNEDVKKEQPQIEEKSESDEEKDIKRKEMEANEVKKMDTPIDLTEPEKPKSDKIK